MKLSQKFSQFIRPNDFKDTITPPGEYETRNFSQEDFV